MKTLIILLTFLFLTACSQNEKKEFNVASGLQSAYNNFISQGKSRGHDLSTNNLIIEWGVINDPAIAAYCSSKKEIGSFPNYTYQVTPYIRVSPEYQGAEPIYLNQIIAHELGHCLLNRKHTDADGHPYLNAAGYIGSIMFSYMVSYVYGEELYGLLEHYYYNELFDPTTPAIDPYTQEVVSSTGTVTSSKVAVPESHKIDPNIIHYTRKDGSCYEGKLP